MDSQMPHACSSSGWHGSLPFRLTEKADTKIEMGAGLGLDQGQLYKPTKEGALPRGPLQYHPEHPAFHQVHLSLGQSYLPPLPSPRSGLCVTEP